MFFQKSSLIAGVLALVSATQTYAANWINVGPVRSCDGPSNIQHLEAKACL
jgi:hypothetical protein